MQCHKPIKNNSTFLWIIHQLSEIHLHPIKCYLTQLKLNFVLPNNIKGKVPCFLILELSHLRQSQKPMLSWESVQCRDMFSTKNLEEFFCLKICNDNRLFSILAFNTRTWLQMLTAAHEKTQRKWIAHHIIRQRTFLVHFLHIFSGQVLLANLVFLLPKPSLKHL